MSKFSFIIPVYNVRPYLRECLDSVISQDYQDFEICLVDDGSNDGSEQICDEYAAQDQRIKLYHQQNGGVSVARNKALEMATGDYIWFVDADDFILPGALKYLDAIIEDSGSDTIFFCDNRRSNLSIRQYDRGNKELFLATHICYCNPMMIFKRQIILNQNIRFSEGIKMGEDLEFQYKYLLHCGSPTAVPINFYFIRERLDSASRNCNSIYNDYYGSNSILSNFIDYLNDIPDRGVSWMGFRLAERLKCYMQSASKLDNIDRKKIQSNVRAYIRQYYAFGYKEFISLSFILSFIDVRFYFIFYKILKLIKKIR